MTSSDDTVYQYTGWQEIDGVTYYYDPTTHQPVTGQQVIQGDVYTFGADGALNRTARGIDVSKFQGLRGATPNFLPLAYATSLHRIGYL